ncbi:unnamed protein product [Clonostachys byssicola]|uniref:SnoaL-like domain-containing protein n=1 Tax=Clonostachys byssicola TaxID=160290 RepID=A0A9N9U552_9HYPO|nr:unnamed protein product [Clonostachys byssicola]
MAEFRAILQKTIDSFVENNTQAVKKQDVALLSAILTDDCVRKYHPRSFVKRYSQFLKPQLTNAEYEAQMKNELGTMKDVQQKITNTVIDTEARTAVLFSEQTITTANGGTSVVEVLWGLTFTEDGSRVAQVLEYVDSQVIEQMLSNMGAH